MQVNGMSCSKSLYFAVSRLWCLMESDRPGGKEEDTEFWRRPLHPLEFGKWNLRILFYLTTAANYLPSFCLMNRILMDSLQLVSSINMPIFRRKNCIHTASGIFALCKRLPSTLVESGQSTLNQSTGQTFTESEDTRCCVNTIFPPEDGHVNARNMSRIIM